MTAIETNQLRKAYGAHQVVKGIDLVIEKGEVFGFLGRNGAGKSTFINMLTGIIRPTSGTFSLLGVHGSVEKVKKRVGVMPDYSTFYESLTAFDHLKFLSALSGKPTGKQHCMAVLRSVGLDGHAHVKTSKFSFGMKKKLGIAQAIIHDPELIFLDEPTSGLDAESVLHIHKLIHDLKMRGKTIFMTSHNLDEVEKVCTRIAIMKEGKVGKIGTMEELRTFYRSTLTVTVKHSPMSKGDQHTMMEWLQSVGTDVSAADSQVTLTLDHEKKIAEVIRAFNQKKIDVYRVSVDEPSLEEIFLEE
ncbi:ABC transporter ATP-binding protein [Bacillus mesophilum]|uniref:ABC transporter ATP-binding protein n=1 Tax=Bacillus mesophilum TaxID=1071718 RepID=A0A7V7RI14_9BACI|nr:ABC transporter ATP-binding protein [Bacillus mesophilum]KAB2329616.1 ABC transporter ATP-binding protein [Bacillus mesophilum]